MGNLVPAVTSATFNSSLIMFHVTRVFSIQTFGVSTNAILISVVLYFSICLGAHCDVF